MKTLTTIHLKPPWFYLLFSAIALLGIWLRLDQFVSQVLLDDEWHVIHQLLARPPAELVKTFGVADFSIPLALLYWLEMKWVGLSELGMRWPMMLAGILFLCLGPLYLRRYFDDRTTLIFMFLVAISPRLVMYSRTARPYAITLLLSLLAVVLFQKFIESEKHATRYGALYMLCAVASSWLHLVTLPMVVAPFVVYGIPALFNGNRERLWRMFVLGLVTLAVLLVAELPPLLSHPEDMAVKLGAQLPDVKTFYGVLFVWMGTGSTPQVLIGVVLATLGAAAAWRRLPVAASLLTGLLLTLALILVTQPAWVQYALTLSRYLLVALPLFLLAVAAGVQTVDDGLVARWGGAGRTISVLLFLPLVAWLAYASPLRKMLAYPNSNSLHSVYQFDYREDENLVVRYQRQFPVSPFWQKLAALPAGSVKIAATPFSFETHQWDAARWERISRQRVMPGFLTGFCGGFWWGEVPHDDDFRFRNAAHLADRPDMVARGFDLLVYQKAFESADESENKRLALTAEQCAPKIRERFGEPVYEDQWIVVFPLNDGIRNLIDATR
jgi:uncharacterized membrane protein